MGFEKVDAEDEASCPLNRPLATPTAAQPISYMDFKLEMVTLNWPSKAIMLDPCKFISTLNLPSKIAMLGLRWYGYGLKLTFSDCHAWPPWSYHDLKLAVERRSYLVLSNATTTSNWPSMIAMLSLKWYDYGLKLTFSDCHTWPPRNYIDLELVAKGGHTWSWITRQRPRIGSHRQPCLVLEDHWRKSWFMTCKEFKIFWVLTSFTDLLKR